MAPPQLLHNLGVREPGGDIGAEGQPVAQLGSRDIERFLLLGHFVDGIVFVLIRQEHHLLEVDHLYAQLFLVLLQQLLGVVRSVERLAGRILAGAGMVAADDQMRAAVVATNDRVPDRLARPAHPHCQRQQRQVGRVLRVVGHQGLVATDARVMVDVARLRHAHDRMHKQIGLFFFGRS